ITAEGELAVPAARLHSLLAAFPGKAAVTIESIGATAYVSHGRSGFKLPTLPVRDLPAPLAITEETGRTELEHSDALALLRPMFAASDEKSRNYLNGALLHNADGGLVSVATDGPRLARVTVAAASRLSSDRRLIVPAAAMTVIGKLFGSYFSAVTLRRSPTLL